MAGNVVTITSDTATLLVQAIQANPASPDMQFSSGSFKGTVDERRVALVIMAIPTGAKLFSVRFEFTDPALATVDIKGVPVYLTKEDRIVPFTEGLREKEDQKKYKELTERNIGGH